MGSKTRRATIVERLSVEGGASVVELAAYFGTLEMAILPDLDFLEVEGLRAGLAGA
ncbi:MAG: hypothetical protein ACRDVC_11205 [Acidimicrobiales bacterium]